MNRISLCIASAMLATSVLAQSTPPQPQPQPQPQKPKPGTIIERPNAGGITEGEKPAPTPAKPVPGKPTGQVVERFEAVGNTSVASDTIRVYLGVNPGDPYDPDLIQRNFLNLWQTGLFDDIKIETDRGTGGGVVVRAVVKERPRIGSVEYRGNKELNATKIQEALEREKIDLHVGNTIEQTLIGRAAAAIKKAYTEGGFEGVAVDVTTEDLTEPGEKKIVFNINEGQKAAVSEVHFVGNKRFSDRRLRRLMKEVQPTNVVSWIRKKNLYIPSKLDEDLEKVKNFYQDYGYQNIAFGDPQVTTVGKGKKTRVRIIIDRKSV